MASALMNATGAQTLATTKPSTRTTGSASPCCLWQPQLNRAFVRSRAPGVARLQRRGPSAFGRSGYWGSCAPGMMGTVNMSGFMNRPLAEVLQQLERDFGAAAQQARDQRGAGGNASDSRTNTMGLPVDTVETADAVWYFADLPGLEKTDLQIQANRQDRSITISGERSPPTVGEEDAQETRLQRKFAKFAHTITLPKDCDEQLVSAKVDKGVLRIKVLKTADTQPEMQTVQID